MNNVGETEDYFYKCKELTFSANIRLFNSIMDSITFQFPIKVQFSKKFIFWSKFIYFLLGLAKYACLWTHTRWNAKAKMSQNFTGISMLATNNVLSFLPIDLRANLWRVILFVPADGYHALML